MIKIPYQAIWNNISEKPLGGDPVKLVTLRTIAAARVENIANPKLDTIPAKETRMSPHTGLLYFAGLTGTGFAQPNRNPMFPPV
ncbi:MAG: hypothetical protein CM1200mP14_08570 [Gammaproteobacteria bacterium]|nr:MAG: hypothetical protein CM1200mP14_08570 [Gammaproteobacteria bacterium]